MKSLDKYLEKIASWDLAQAKNELVFIVQQQQQVWAGAREAIDWPFDGAERRPEIKYSVGPAVPHKDEARDIVRYPDGSIKSARYDAGVRKYSSPGVM